MPKNPVQRPIAKGDVFVKLASKIAYQRASLKVKKYPSTRNVSLGLSGGCEFVMHILNAALKHSDNDDIHCKADVRHCFQTITCLEPKCCSTSSPSAFSDIFHLLHFLYGDESAMLLHMGRNLQYCMLGCGCGCGLHTGNLSVSVSPWPPTVRATAPLQLVVAACGQPKSVVVIDRAVCGVGAPTVPPTAPARLAQVSRLAWWLSAACIFIFSQAVRLAAAVPTQVR